MRHLLITLVVPAALHAQGTAPSEFPEGAQPLAADALRERIAGKVFDVKLADGTGWRIEYRGNGYYFVDTTTGFRDDGRWRIDGPRLCHEARKGASGCSEVRDKDGRIHIKRATTGEVIALMPR